MAVNKQLLDYVINVRANVDLAIKSMKNLTSSLADLSKMGNIGKDVEQALGKINKVIADTEELLNKPINSIKVFDKLKSNIDDAAYLLTNIGKKINEVNNADDNKKIEFIDSKALDNIKRAQDNLDKIGKKYKDATAASEKLSKAEQKETDAKKNYEETNKKLEERKLQLKDLKTAYDAFLKAQNADATEADINEADTLIKQSGYYKKGIKSAGIIGENGLTNIANKVTAEEEAVKRLTDRVLDLQNTADAATRSVEALKTSIKAGAVTTGDWDKLTNDLQLLGISLEGIEVGDIDAVLERINNFKSDKINEATEALNRYNITTEETKELLPKARKEVNDESNTFRENAEAANYAQQSVNNFKNRLILLTGLTGSVALLRKAFNNAMSTIKELDATMTEMAVVTDSTIGDYWNQLPEYAQRAKLLGMSINDVYQASTLYYQLGLKALQVNELTIATLKMARIAGLDSAEATSRMTNALRGFNMELNLTNAERVADVYSKLAAISAADVDEISTAMTKVASLANSANMSFENTAAFLTLIVETTRESAETAGTALKTVIARFSELKTNPNATVDSEGETLDYNKIDTALKSIGLSLDKFMAGEEGLDEVFLRLAKLWDTLDVKTQRYIATQAAGSRLQSRFIAMMSNYTRTQELAGEAIESSGASTELYEKTMDSLLTKIANFKTEWQLFTMSLIDNEFVKSIVLIGTNILLFINNILGDSTVGRIVLIVSTLSVAGTVLNKLFKSVELISTSIAKNIGLTIGDTIATKVNSTAKTENTRCVSKNLKTRIIHRGEVAKEIPTLTAETVSTKLNSEAHKEDAASTLLLSKALKFLKANLVGVGVVAAVAGMALISYLNSSDYAVKKLNKANEALNEAQTAYDEINTLLTEISERIHELENLDAPTLADLEELETLRLLREELEKIVALKEAELKTEKKKQLKATDNYLESLRNDIANLQLMLNQVQWYNQETGEWEAADPNTNEDAKRYWEKKNLARVDLILSLIEEDAIGNKKEINQLLDDAFADNWYDATEYLNIKFGETTLKDWYKQISQVLITDWTDSDLFNILGTEGLNAFKLAFGETEEGLLILRNTAASYKEIVSSIETTTITPTLNLTEATTELNSFSKKLEIFSNLNKNLLENNKVSLSDLSEIVTEFSSLGTNLDPIIEKISQFDKNTTLEEKLEVYSELITLYINSEEVLVNLTEANKNYYIELLKGLGITNAAEIVEVKLLKARLKSKEITYLQAKAQLELNKSLFESELAYNLALGALLAYNINESAVTSNGFLQAIDIRKNSILKYATACGKATEAVVLFSKAEEALTEYEKINAKIEKTKTLDISATSKEFIILRLTLSASDVLDKAATKLRDDLDAIFLNDNNEIKLDVDFGTEKQDAEDFWVSPLEKHYNLLQKITREQRNLNKAASEYEIITANTLGDRKKLTDLMTKQMLAQVNEKAYQEELLKKRKEDLLQLNSDYASYSQYMKYDETTNRLVVNLDLWDKLSGTIEGDSDLAKKLDEIKDNFEEALEAVRETEDAINDVDKSIAEAIGLAELDKIDLTNTIVDMLVEKEQKSIDLQLQQLDATKEANEALIASILNNFTKLRQDRLNQETENDITSLTRKLAFLRLDTSGSNALEIKKLEKELREKTLSYSDTLIDLGITDLEALNAADIEILQKMLDNLLSMLDWMKENGGFNDEAEAIITEAMNATDLESTQLYQLFKDANTSLAPLAFTSEWQDVSEKLYNINAWLNNYKNITPTDENGKKANIGANNTGDITPSEALGVKKGSLTMAMPNIELNQSNSYGYNNANSELVKQLLLSLKTAGWTIDVDGSYGPKTAAAVSSLQKAIGLTETGKWDSNTRETWIKWLLDNAGWTAFDTGGLANFTGPAWLDGTKSSPELVLNAQDTANFIQLKDILKGVFSNDNQKSLGGNYAFNVEINVDEIANDYDVDSLANRIKEDIVNAMSYRNNTLVSALR